MEQAAHIFKSAIPAEHLAEPGLQLTKTQKSILDATPDCVKIMNKEGILLTMNRAGCVALNVPEDSSFGMEWLSLLPSDLRDAGVLALAKAASAQTARFSGRTISSTGDVYWDNLLTPFKNADDEVVGILCVSRDVTEKVTLEQALEEAINRERLLAGEMQHRIKNLFSMTSALSQIAEREAAQENTSLSATEILREKLFALARASNAMFADPHGPVGKSATMCLQALIQSILAPYGSRCHIEGLPLSIPRDMGTNLALFLHEHATNSIKYGAMSSDNGFVTIDWAKQENTLALEWSELNGPALAGPPSHQGFGSKMVERIVASAGGSLERLWPTEGLIAKLRIPLRRTS